MFSSGFKTCENKGILLLDFFRDERVLERERESEIVRERKS